MYLKSVKLKRAVLSAMLAALIFIATAVFPIPLGNGYANLGDAIIAVAAFFVGPLWGALAAGVGSAFADVFLGYTVYAPATFIIKAIMAVIFFYIFRPFAKGRASAPMAFTASFCSEVFMIVGYFLFEAVLYTPAGAIPNIMGNSVQGLVGCAVATVLVSLFSHNRFFMKHSSTNRCVIMM